MSALNSYLDSCRCVITRFLGFFTNISFVIGTPQESEKSNCFTPHVFLIPLPAKYFVVLHTVHNIPITWFLRAQWFIIGPKDNGLQAEASLAARASAASEGG